MWHVSIWNIHVIPNVKACNTIVTGYVCEGIGHIFASDGMSYSTVILEVSTNYDFNIWIFCFYFSVKEIECANEVVPICRIPNSIIVIDSCSVIISK